MTTELREKIERVCDPKKDGWTDKEQGWAMVEAILKRRHPVSVEIGCWAGKGLVCLACAHKEMNLGKAMGIDPWSAPASVEGMTPEHAEWWGKVDHERIFLMCQENLKRHHVEEFATLVRMKSENAPVPSEIGLLRIDGNHGPKSIIDVRRFAPNVVDGGSVFLDDVTWPNGPLENGADEELFELGFKKTGEIGGTYVFERKRK